MADTKTNITVHLTGTDGNIFCVIAKVRVKLSAETDALTSSKNSPITSLTAVPTKRLSAECWNMLS